MRFAWVLLCLAACGKHADVPAPVVGSDTPAPVAGSDAPAPIDAAVVEMPLAARALLDATDDAHADSWPEALLAWHQSGAELVIACGDAQHLAKLSPLLVRVGAYLGTLDPARADDPHLAALLHLGHSLRRSTVGLPILVGLDLSVRVARWGHDHGVKVRQLEAYPVADDLPISAQRIELACMHDTAATASPADLGMPTEAEYRQGRREMGLDADVALDTEVPTMLAFLRETIAQLGRVKTVDEMTTVMAAREELARTQTRSVLVRVSCAASGRTGRMAAKALAEYRELTK